MPDGGGLEGGLVLKDKTVVLGLSRVSISPTYGYLVVWVTLRVGLSSDGKGDSWEREAARVERRPSCKKQINPKLAQSQ